jgi:hypothetical protein
MSKHEAAATTARSGDSLSAAASKRAGDKRVAAESPASSHSSDGSRGARLTPVTEKPCSGSETIRRRWQTPDGYWNPYLAGFALGLVLFASFIVTGHGLGASGGLARLATSLLSRVSSQLVDTTGFFAGLGGGPKNPLMHWIVWELFGVLLGGFASGMLARRVSLSIGKGPRISNRTRLALALLGGIIVGWGTQLSRGCTSGQALSGGAVLAAGSWAFMFSVFGGGYVVAWPLRRLWR